MHTLSKLHYCSVLLTLLLPACPTDTPGTPDPAGSSTGSTGPTTTSPLPMTSPPTTAAVDSSTSDDGSTTDSTTTAADTTAGDSDSGSSTSTTGPVELDAADFIPVVAQATCDALFRCCDDPTSLEAYFAQYANSPRLEEFAPMLPPMGEVTAENCAALVTEMMTIRPFGPWIDAVNNGLVEYDGVVAQECVDTMDAATCDLADGETFSQVSAALGDRSCLSFSAPFGGDEQRSMFSRTATEGEPCSNLSDGSGGSVYGTCDSNQSFCCIEGDTPGNCFLSGDIEQGVCQQTSEVGEDCFLDFAANDAQFCRTGLNCSDLPFGTCLAPPPQVDLRPNDQCYDGETFNTLGTCPDGYYCDIFGTELCELRRADGEACDGGGECLNGGCNDGMCGPNLFCAGV